MLNLMTLVTFCPHCARYHGLRIVPAPRYAPPGAQAVPAKAPTSPDALTSCVQAGAFYAGDENLPGWIA